MKKFKRVKIKLLVRLFCQNYQFENKKLVLTRKKFGMNQIMTTVTILLGTGKTKHCLGQNMNNCVVCKICGLDWLFKLFYLIHLLRNKLTLENSFCKCWVNRNIAVAKVFFFLGMGSSSINESDSPSSGTFFQGCLFVKTVFLSSRVKGFLGFLKIDKSIKSFWSWAGTKAGSWAKVVITGVTNRQTGEILLFIEDAFEFETGMVK